MGFKRKMNFTPKFGLFIDKCGSYCIMWLWEVIITENTSINKDEIPAEAIEALARCLLPEILKFFNSESGKREFAEWKANQTTNQTEQAA